MDPSADRTGAADRRRHALTVVGAEYAAMARETTADLPAWFRPVAMVFIWTYGLLMSLVIAPFTLLMVPRLWAYLRFTKAVRRHVRSVWQEESPEEAVRIARRILTELAHAYPRRVRIPPYGAATSRWALTIVGDMAYSAHVALHDWQGALEVAEQVLAAAGPDAHWEWTISRAKALHHTGQREEARALLEDLLEDDRAGPEARLVLAGWEGEDGED